MNSPDAMDRSYMEFISSAVKEWEYTCDWEGKDMFTKVFHRNLRKSITIEEPFWWGRATIRFHESTLPDVTSHGRFTAPYLGRCIHQVKLNADDWRKLSVEVGLRKCESVDNTRTLASERLRKFFEEV